KESLWETLEAAFLLRDAEQHVVDLQQHDVPAALIKTVPEALADARAAARGMILALENDRGEAIEVVGNPIRFVGEARAGSKYPPRLGQDSVDVLSSWLGMAGEEVDRLMAQGVLCQKAGEPAGNA